MVTVFAGEQGFAGHLLGWALILAYLFVWGAVALPVAWLLACWTTVKLEELRARRALARLANLRHPKEGSDHEND